MTPPMIHGEPFAVRKYHSLEGAVTWHHHSEYRTLDIWAARTYYDNVEHPAGLYKSYPEGGHVIVGHTLAAVKAAIREYLGEGAR